MYNEEIIKGYNELKNENISKADKMFEKIGYKKIRKENDSYEIRYVKEFKRKRPKHIIFSLDKTISVCEENEKELAVNRDYFTMQELQAINEKVKELGWYE